MPPIPISGSLLNKQCVSHPQYSDFSARLVSFQGWPKSVSQLPLELSEAGMFHTGRGDEIVCFYCGLGLRDWRDEDNVWIEHAKWGSKCEYLFFVKGRKFVEDVVNGRPFIEDERRVNCFKNRLLCNNRLLCKICYSEEVAVLFQPCGHLVSCVFCSIKLKDCAICRIPVVSLFTVYL